MYINSNHIRVVKLLQSISNPNLEFVGEILNIGESNVIQYIRSIYKYINPKATTFKKQEMIESIVKERELVEKLQKYQEVTKEERQVYIIFSLLVKKDLNLTDLAEFFSITRRSLNNDILEIKGLLERWEIEILSDNFKGIRLIGKEDTIKKLLNNFLYKNIIELEELPKVLKDIYGKYFEDKNYKELTEESKKFITEMGMNRYFNIQDIYATFALTFVEPMENTLKIKELSTPEEFHILCRDSFDEEYSRKLFHSLKNTYFGNFSVYDIQNLILFVKMSNGDLYMRDEGILERAKKFKTYIENKMGINIINSEEYDFHVTRMIFFSQTSFDIKLKDFTFLALNLNSAINSELMEIYLYLRTEMYNANFVSVLNLYLYLSYQREQRVEEDSKNYLLYKNIPDHLLSIVTDKVERQHGIKIIDTVDFDSVDFFLKESTPDNFIVLEKFEYDSSKVNVRYLPFPL